LNKRKNSERQYRDLVAPVKRTAGPGRDGNFQLEKSVREKMSSLDKEKLALHENGLIWPVPKNLVTTYFHDPDYPFRYLFEHPGVISAPPKNHDHRRRFRLCGARANERHGLRLCDVNSRQWDFHGLRPRE